MFGLDQTAPTKEPEPMLVVPVAPSATMAFSPSRVLATKALAPTVTAPLAPSTTFAGLRPTTIGNTNVLASALLTVTESEEERESERHPAPDDASKPTPMTIAMK